LKSDEASGKCRCEGKEGSDGVSIVINQPSSKRKSLHGFIGVASEMGGIGVQKFIFKM
jgi:hypothetical protein